MATKVFLNYTYKGENYPTLKMLRKAIFNMDGVLFSGDLTDELKEKFGVVENFEEVVPVAPPIEVEPTEEELLSKALEDAKKVRQDIVDHLVVEIETERGIVSLDADETSQSRMAKTVIAMRENELPDETTITWVAADNSIVQLTRAQLAEALLKAGLAQTAVWTDPYTGGNKLVEEPVVTPLEAEDPIE